jgi:hypothetical protein
MDHAVTVGAQETKIPDLCLVAGFQRVNGFGVMALDETFPVVAITLAEVKTAGFARQSTERSQRLFPLSLDQGRIAFVAVVQRGDNPALLRLLNSILGSVGDDFAVFRVGERLTNGPRHCVATLRSGGKCVPDLLLRLPPRESPRLPASVNTGSNRRKFISFI